MPNQQSADTILGFIPKDKYVRFTYTLVLVASVISFINMLLFLVGGFVPFGGIGSIGALAGLAALVMAVLGLFMFKDSFSELDQNHLQFLCVFFAIFFVLGAILNSALAFFVILWLIVMIAFSAAQLLVFYAGFNAHRQGRVMVLDKDGVISEVKRAMARN
jgi:hypothetical protein